MPHGFLVSSRHSLPSPTLRGYAFQGLDLVIDDDGRRSYGGAVEAGEDGSYVSVSTTGRAAAIGTDRAAYSRLFVYRSGDRWVVGSSFIEVAEEAARNGWALTPAPYRLQTFAMTTNIGNQLVTHSTVFDEISLLPADRWIQITRGAFRLKLSVRNHEAPVGGHYKERLADFLKG